MSLRIVAGSKGGSRLISLGGLATRPMGERARQAVFSMLGERVVDATVLDLFAGSGALALEALSRGAAAAIFVENAPDAVEIIGRNIGKLGFSDRARVIQADVLCPDLYADQGSHSDVIFIDPPYEMVRVVTAEGHFGMFLAELAERDVLKSDGIIVLGHHRTSTVEENFGPLTLADRRNYGTNGVSFLEIARRS